MVFDSMVFGGFSVLRSSQLWASPMRFGLTISDIQIADNEEDPTAILRSPSVRKGKQDLPRPKFHWAIISTRFLVETAALGVAPVPKEFLLEALLAARFHKSAWG